MKGVVGAFANDKRILAWDLWNEPDNGNDSSYAKGDPKNKNEIIVELLPQVFAWARAAKSDAAVDERAVARGLEFAGEDAAGGADSD